MASSNVKENKFSAGKFYRSVKSEIKKVTWPTRQDVWNYTLVVLAMCAFSAIFIGALDLIFKSIFELLA
ncbi:MAG: preprotein translocase subunit SecE [Clostridiales bacterium 38-18]|nr:MAG: preprotein translocase subunit SecE [Clostridiales bacterium 38-18]